MLNEVKHPLKIASPEDVSKFVMLARRIGGQHDKW